MALDAIAPLSASSSLQQLKKRTSTPTMEMPPPPKRRPHLCLLPIPGPLSLGTLSPVLDHFDVQNGVPGSTGTYCAPSSEKDRIHQLQQLGFLYHSHPCTPYIPKTKRCTARQESR